MSICSACAPLSFGAALDALSRLIASFVMALVDTPPPPLGAGDVHDKQSIDREVLLSHEDILPRPSIESVIQQTGK